MRRHSRAHRPRRRADGARLARYAGRRRRHRPRGARFAALHRADFRRRAPGMDEDAFERKLYVVRKRAENEVCESGHRRHGDSSTSRRSPARTIVYKGLLLAPQIANFYRELSDPDVMSALCLVHQRFSTNTFPTWQLAHPYPLHRAQRRDQHAARQRELDARAPVGAGVAALRRRHQEAVPDHCSPTAATRPPSTTRVELLLQVRPQPAARHGDADSRSVGRQSAHERRRSGRSTNTTRR